MNKIINIIFKKFKEELAPRREAKIYIDGHFVQGCKVATVTFDENGKERISGICEDRWGRKIKIDNFQDEKEVRIKLKISKDSKILIKYERDYTRLITVGKFILTSIDCSSVIFQQEITI